METTTELATIDTAQVAVIVESAPKALETNKLSVERATAAGQTLLDTIQGEGMNDELDAKCNSFLTKVKKTIEEMKARRVPVTQIFDFIKSQFTAQENSLDPKKPDSVYALIQKERDKYAAEKIAEQRRKEAEAQRKLELDKELIRIKSEVQTQLATHFNDFLTLRIKVLNDLFNELTLEKFDSLSLAIQSFPCEYSHAHFGSFIPRVRAIYTTDEQLQSIIIECTKEAFGKFDEEFRSKMTSVRSEIADRLPSRKTELEEIAKVEEAAREAAATAKSKAQKEAAALETARAAEMKAAAEKRAAEEAEKQRVEEAQRTAASASRINTEAQASMTNSLFDAQEAVSSAPAPMAQVRESFEIEVNNPLGYFLIAQFYFEREGKTETVAKLEKKTLGSMKKFCESWATKNDEKITSPFLKYSEKFKTIAKK